jgi:hypothetical protein
LVRGVRAERLAVREVDEKTGIAADRAADIGSPLVFHQRNQNRAGDVTGERLGRPELDDLAADQFGFVLHMVQVVNGGHRDSRTLRD